ncbi:MAG: CheR family methyltransferase [Xanthobacteraceae bacterium]
MTDSSPDGSARPVEPCEDMAAQEFALRDSDFRKIVKLVMEKTGIVISDRKRAFVHGRLGRRLRALGLSNFGEYCRLLESPGGEAEHPMLVNAITTNHTSFFREPHHFDCLTKTVLPAIAQRRGAGSGRLRIWSAGCSTGEEPYTLAMVMCGFEPMRNWDRKILATDLDTSVIARAKAGLYDPELVQTIPETYRTRFVATDPDGRARMSDELRALIAFAPLNLLNPWPMKGPFDVVFCRNVVIYFDKPTQARLFNRYADILRPDGWLFIGHSESLLNLTDRFELVGRTVYRRIK